MIITDNIVVGQITSSISGKSINVDDVVNSTRGILQVVHKVIDAQFSMTSGKTDKVIDGFTIDITPKAENSIFRIDVKWFGEVDHAWDTGFNVRRNGIRLFTQDDSQTHQFMPALTYHDNNNSSTPEMACFYVIDTTGSVKGEKITFDLITRSSDNYTLWTNRCFNTGSGYETGISFFTVTEIGGVK